IFTGIAAVGLVIFAGGSWHARPKLAIAENSLIVRGWFTTQSLLQVNIKIIRITEFRRIRRRVRLLEIETSDDQLLVFSRWDLGTDPLNVLDALIAAGYKF
ncbi:MAG: PH domain-containing protein, partial [Mycobacteriaceae bacterium]|nr:PH domain-containing protein [Mycobacteriaceae bacterium]